MEGAGASRGEAWSVGGYKVSFGVSGSERLAGRCCVKSWTSSNGGGSWREGTEHAIIARGLGVQQIGRWILPFWGGGGY